MLAPSKRINGSEACILIDIISYCFASITCSFKLRVRNLLSSWQHVCSLVTPEAQSGLARKGTGLAIFTADGLHLIRHPAVEEEHEIHAYTRVKDQVCSEGRTLMNDDATKDMFSRRKFLET